MQPLKIQLFSKTDTDNQIFHIGKLKFPGKLTLGRGAAFLIFLDGDIQELHIAPATAPSLYDPFKYYNQSKTKSSRSKHHNISVELCSQLEELTDGDSGPPRKFYIGRLDVKAEIDVSNGVVFLVFTADTNEEELQISVPDTRSSNKPLWTQRKIKRSHEYD